MACCCASLAKACELYGPWLSLSALEGLSVADGASAWEVLRQASVCTHWQDWPSSEFEWSCEHGGLEASCKACGRLHDVTLTTGFVDTRAFSSKLVTRAQFRARHEAPRHLQVGQAQVMQHICTRAAHMHSCGTYVLMRHICTHAAHMMDSTRFDSMTRLDSTRLDLPRLDSSRLIVT